MTYLEILTDALRELGILDAEQTAQAADAAFVLRKLNRIFDNWNAEGAAAYALVLADHTLTAGLNPHTIGASGTFTATRPEAIDEASIVVNSIVYRLNLRDAQWWARLSDPTLAGTIPTDLWYRESYPNGSLYLWPVPSAVATLRLLTRTPFASVASVDTFSLPPGYQDALTLTLAEDIAGPYGVALPPLLPVRAGEARARIFRANSRPPRLCTTDVGMGSRRGDTWDYQTGLYR